MILSMNLRRSSACRLRLKKNILEVLTEVVEDDDALLIRFAMQANTVVLIKLAERIHSPWSKSDRYELRCDGELLLELNFGLCC